MSAESAPIEDEPSVNDDPFVVKMLIVDCGPDTRFVKFVLPLLVNKIVEPAPGALIVRFEPLRFVNEIVVPGAAALRTRLDVLMGDAMLIGPLPD